MTELERSLKVMEELFAKDCIFALATSEDNVPSVRYVDTYYQDRAFYIVAYKATQKGKEINKNENVALCHMGHRFTGRATIIGHPLLKKNEEIREKLIKVFSKWYFEHNNEDHKAMCYIKVDLDTGFFDKDGTGYKVDFRNSKVKTFPFSMDAPE